MEENLTDGRPPRSAAGVGCEQALQFQVTHWESSAVQVCAGRVPAGHNKLSDGGCCIMTTHLPAEVMWAQPEEDFPGGFEVDRQASGMLHGRMNISKIPLQPMLAVDAVGARRME
jgi:hypothetical protein